MFEASLAILVVDSKRRYCNERIVRNATETIEEFAERVKQHLVTMLTKPNHV